MLITLEKIVGEQTLQRAVHTYFMRYRFQHPTQEDFMRTVNEVAGQDLSWYWKQAVYGTAGHGLRGKTRRLRSGEVVGRRI